MKFNDLGLNGAYTIELEKKGDDRGFFARFFCVDEFRSIGIKFEVKQINNSLSAERGTLRGMHYQLPPFQESKIVRCIKGSLFDVVLDLRKDSPTFGKWYGVELSAENRLMMLVPKGFAHGFLTLEGNTEALYLVDEFYNPDAERGVRWDDPTFGIEWPIIPSIISDKDRKHPDYQYHL